MSARSENPSEIRQAVERDARVREMVEIWRSRLNLRNQDIRFDPTWDGDRLDDAHIWFADSQSAAVIKVHPDLDGKAAEVAVAHELLHAVLREWALMAARLLVHVKDDLARIHLNEMLEDAEERVIEDIARALVPGAPRVNVDTAPPDKREIWAVFK